MITSLMPKTLLQSVAAQLERERKRLQDELTRVTAALTAFGKVYLNGPKPKRVAKSKAKSPKKRTMSVAARKKIAAAQKARWAKVKAGKK